MKEKSLLQNYIFNLIYQVVAIALPLVTTPYLSHVLGAEPIGQYSFAQSIVSYFALFAALGTTLYGQRQIAKAKNDPTERSRLFWEIFLLRLAGAALAAVVYCCTIMPTASAPVLYAVAAIEILTIAFDITWFYQGVENFAPIAVCVTVARLLITAGVFILVKSKEDLVLYVLLAQITQMIVIFFVINPVVVIGMLKLRNTLKLRLRAIKAVINIFAFFKAGCSPLYASDIPHMRCADPFRILSAARQRAGSKNK